MEDDLIINEDFILLRVRQRVLVVSHHREGTLEEEDLALEEGAKEEKSNVTHVES